MAAKYFDDEQRKPPFKIPPISRAADNHHVRSLFSSEHPWFSHVVYDILKREFCRSVPKYSEDKGPAVVLESRYGEPGELQCMATLLDELGMPLRHAVEGMFFDSQSGSIRVTVCSSDIFLAKIIAGRLDDARNAYNEADHGMSGHAGLTVAYGDESLAYV
jgi:hypothetical protein